MGDAIDLDTRWGDETVSGYSVDISDEEVSDIEYDIQAKCSTKPIFDIWEQDCLQLDLQTLPGSDDIKELIKSKSSQKLLEHPNGLHTGLLFSVWYNEITILKTILNNRGDPQITDGYGRSAIHLAAYRGYPECVQILLDYGASPNVWDNARKVTPLHCAASRGCVKTVRVLLKAFADVNAGLSYRSPLHYAVQSNAIECVKELLEAKACPNTPQIFTETPLHVAASMGFPECMKLLLKFGADVRVQFGTEKITPLHLAAEDENPECATLLLNAGANIEAKNNRNQTPLHLACLSQSSETTELLLKRGADPNVQDKNGRTPLHGAIVKVSRTHDCVRLLLNAGGKVNKPDIYGYTPLHIAALNEFSGVVMLLINHGGDVTARTNGGISALSFILRKTPDVLPKYVTNLDSAISLNEHEIGDVDCELKLDFRILVPCVDRGEIELLINFIEVGQKQMLKHPLCETFLFLKWRQIRKFFIFSLVYHTLFVILFTVYVKNVFLKNCEAKPMMRVARVNPCTIDNYVVVIGYVLLVLNFLSLSKEVFQFAHNWRGYVRHWENWLQWLVIVCVFLCNSPTSFTHDITLDFTWWQHHVAAWGIFLAWVELMMIVGRFPIFGLYIQMFTTVAMNFSKFLLAYSCLLIAFGLSFGVLFANSKPFPNVWSCLLKVFIMMSGELEYEDLFFDDDRVISYPGTAHVLYFIFVLLVTIILNNLLVGLAVSDIQGLQQGAGLSRLVRLTELMAHLESMFFSPRLQCLPNKLLDFFHKRALLLTTHYHWELFIRPNDPREKKIPKELIRNIYQVVAERKDRCKYRSRRYKRAREYVRNVSKTGSSKSNIEYTSQLFGDSTESLNKFRIKLLQTCEEIQRSNVTIQTKLNQINNYLNNIK